MYSKRKKGNMGLQIKIQISYMISGVKCTNKRDVIMRTEQMVCRELCTVLGHLEKLQYVSDNANECQIRVERTFNTQCSGSGQQKQLGWPLKLAFIFILGTFNYEGSKSTNRVFDVNPYRMSHFRKKCHPIQS